ncbi:primosomal protein N' [Nocardia bovistercoris]
MLPLLTPAHLDRDFDYVVPPELDEIAQPGVRVRIRFAGRLVDGYLLRRLERTEHTGKMVRLERVVSAERVLTPEVLSLAVAVAHRYAGTRADVLRLAIPPRHARTENGGAARKKSAEFADDNSDEFETPAVAPDSGPGDMVSARNAESARESPANSEDREHEFREADAKTAHPESIGRAETPSVRHDPAAASQARAARAVDPAQTVEATAGADGACTAASSDSIASASDAEISSPHSGAKGEFATPARGPEFGSPEDVAGYVSSGAEGERFGAVVEYAASGEDVGSASSVVDRGGVSSGAVAGSDPTEGRIGSADQVESRGAIGPNAADGDAARSEVSSVVAFDHAPWEHYLHGGAFVAALADGRGVRAAWQALPGEDWARRLAELAATVAAAGRSAILLVPDQRDLDRVLAECVLLVGDSAVGLSAGLGPAARYRRWLAVLRGQAKVVVGTRAAAFAPAVDLGLVAIWDDGDDTYAEPRAPYPHAREVAMLRAHETGAAFVVAGFARTAEAQAVVDSGWARDLVADRAVVRRHAPRISAPGDSDIALERDPIARAIRIPGVAFAAARAALKEGAPVLVQVPRRGYVPALACAKCRTPARCRHCNGALALPERRGRGDDPNEARSPACRWCGITEAAFRCTVCASRALRAVVIGAVRTAEELGRAFPDVPIRGSSGGALLDTVDPGPQVVVATVGAEPTVRGGYGVALLLDSWALLGRADLRAAEDALRRWMGAAALVRANGQVVVVAEPSLPTVQALVRWDPVGHARAEVDARAEVGFPPAVRMAAIDGATDAIDELLRLATLPADAEVLGPVPLPPFARKPFAGDSPAEVERMILRVHRRHGPALARALIEAQAVRSTHRSDAPLRVQIDPVDIG